MLAAALAVLVVCLLAHMAIAIATTRALGMRFGCLEYVLVWGVPIAGAGAVYSAHSRWATVRHVSQIVDCAAQPAFSYSGHAGYCADAGSGGDCWVSSDCGPSGT
jgi:hypothetical protein